MSLFGRFAAYVEHARARRKLLHDARTLAALSDHMLRDIGMTRAEVRQLASDAFATQASGRTTL